MDWNKAREILSASARKPDGAGGNKAFGAGILDAAGALGAGILDAAGALGASGDPADKKIGAEQ